MAQSFVDKKTDHQAFKMKGMWRSHDGKTITWLTFLEPVKHFKLPSLPRNQPLLGIFWGGRGTKIMGKLFAQDHDPLRRDCLRKSQEAAWYEAAAFQGPEGPTSFG